MRRVAGMAVPGAMLLLGACAGPPPTAPSVIAMPSKGKSFEAFQADDAACRQFAASQVPEGQAEAANQSAIESALLGGLIATAEGAAVGGAIGNPAAGAAIGAATGVLLGGELGIASATASRGPLQFHYDVGYVQCMAAKGEAVPTHFVPYHAYGQWPYPTDTIVGGYFY
ncbi:MAG TPA: glycine zipper family protein [Stellaceae bacterium]|nr:glycine zipper family protein [Stellaceae bacterium]